MKLVFGCDHAGLALKKKLMEAARAWGHTVEDIGCYTADSVDYPDYGREVAEIVAAGTADRGVAICYTGIGICMAANKVHGVRCALCSESFSAMLTRAHNDTNVLALGAGFVGAALAEEILRVWLETEFSGEERHARRVQKIMDIER